MDYAFYKTLDEGALKKLKNTQIPTAAYKIPGNAEISKIVRDILSERGLKPSDFNLTKIRKSFFKSNFRPAIVFPEWNDDKAIFEEDDIYPGFLKLKLKFTLPSGSFATMLIKGLDVT